MVCKQIPEWLGFNYFPKLTPMRRNCCFHDTFLDALLWEFIVIMQVFQKFISTFFFFIVKRE